MSDSKSYDLVVIGAGPAGEMGAVTAAIYGKRVAIVEKNAVVGGAATNTGTLPSKTLRETALALSGLRARELFGVDLSLRREATVGDFLHHERNVKSIERGRIIDRLMQRGIDLYHGAAAFVDPHTIRVVAADRPEELLHAEKVLIAIGSAPMRPPEFPFEHDHIHDSDELLDMTELPKSMAVVGAGVIGSEYACTFAALGAKVHVVDGRDTLLPFLDLEVAQSLTAAMEKLGIVFHWKEKVTTCEAPASGPIRLILSSGNALVVDTVLVAAGRASNTAALNLDAAGITPAKRGLLSVDEHLRTEVKHIYAAGDVVGFPALASTSSEQACVAACHAFDIPGKPKISTLQPYGIFTIPEVSMVGETEGSLKGKGIDYAVGKALYRQNPRGTIIGDHDGFLKLLFRRSDQKLLGVHIIGEQATELVHIGLMAMLLESGGELFNVACFNYPTLGELYKMATYSALVNGLRHHAGEQPPVAAQ